MKLPNLIAIIGERLSHLTRKQSILAGIMAALVAGSTVTGGVIIYGYEQPEIVVAQTDTEDTESEEALENVLEDVTESETESGPVLVSLVGSSIEKDLKIKIQDQNSTDVTGADFVISVTKDEKKAKTTTYEDDDQDGIIYIKSIEAGTYTVSLNEIDGYETEEESISVKVKDEIDYEAVDVTDEIKSESEVSAAEDAGSSNSVEQESVASDTVTYVESTTSAGKTVSGSAVSTSNFPTASLGSTVTTEITLTSASIVPLERNYVATSATESVTEDSTQSDTQTNTTTASTVTVSYPGSATLYTKGTSSSTSATLTLSYSTSVSTSVSWASDNTGVVTVSGSGNSATISAVAAGSANVTATISYSGGSSSITIPVTVSDSSSVTLKDSSGNTLYTDTSCTTVATLASYSTSATYYTGIVYTGWQTINGKVYYYTEDHVAVTGTQVIGGVTYNFGSDGALSSSSGTRGIDVSKWQGSIDWSAVKASGISYVIIRLGYRGTQTGALVEDSYFKKNIAGATAAGLKVGVYFFTQAVTEAEAVEEASMCLSLCSGYSLSYPIFIDTEEGSRANSLDKATRTAIVNAFCKTIVNGGRTAGVYASKSWFNSNLNVSNLGNYVIWVAQYASSCTYSGRYNMWQYSSKGSVAGISGYVDMNISYM